MSSRNNRLRRPILLHGRRCDPFKGKHVKAMKTGPVAPKKWKIK